MVEENLWGAERDVFHLVSLSLQIFLTVLPGRCLGLCVGVFWFVLFFVSFFLPGNLIFSLLISVVDRLCLAPVRQSRKKKVSCVIAIRAVALLSALTIQQSRRPMFSVLKWQLCTSSGNTDCIEVAVFFQFVFFCRCFHENMILLKVTLQLYSLCSLTEERLPATFIEPSSMQMKKKETQNKASSLQRVRLGVCKFPRQTNTQTTSKEHNLKI